MAGLSRPLPAEDRLVLLPKNPGLFFVFWQFSAGRAESFRNSVFSAEVELSLAATDGGPSSSPVKARWDEGRVYLPVPQQGRSYLASLYVTRNGARERLLESNQAAAPSAGGSPDDRAYASLEFHKRVNK